MGEKSADTPTVEAAASELDARQPPHLLAWGLVVLGAVLVIFAPILGVLATGAAAIIAHQTKAFTPRVAALALLIVGIMLLIFNGVSGFLGGGLFSA